MVWERLFFAGGIHRIFSYVTLSTLCFNLGRIFCWMRNTSDCYICNYFSVNWGVSLFNICGRLIFENIKEWMITLVAQTHLTSFHVCAGQPTQGCFTTLHRGAPQLTLRWFPSPLPHPHLPAPGVLPGKNSQNFKQKNPQLLYNKVTLWATYKTHS